MNNKTKDTGRQLTMSLIEEIDYLLKQALHIIDAAYYTDIHNFEKNTKDLRKVLQIMEKIRKKTKLYTEDNNSIKAVYIITIVIDDIAKTMIKLLKKYNYILIRQTLTPLPPKILEKKIELNMKIKRTYQEAYRIYNWIYPYLQKLWLQTINQQEEKTESDQVTTTDLKTIIQSIMKSQEENHA